MLTCLHNAYSKIDPDLPNGKVWSIAPDHGATVGTSLLPHSPTHYKPLFPSGRPVGLTACVLEELAATKLRYIEAQRADRSIPDNPVARRIEFERRLAVLGVAC